MIRPARPTLAEVPLADLSLGESEGEDAALKMAAEFRLDVARHGLHGTWDYVHFTHFAPGAVLGLIGLVTLAIWAHATKRAIAMESPFVAPGVCPECGAGGDPAARFCCQRGRALFGLYYAQCSGCLGRIPAHAAFCPQRGVGRV